METKLDALGGPEPEGDSNLVSPSMPGQLGVTLDKLIVLEELTVRLYGEICRLERV